MNGTPLYDLGWNKFDWERLIVGEHKKLIAPELPSTTRHVLLTLSVWMRGTVEGHDAQDIAEMEGYNCFPTTRRLAKNTGLSQRCVIEHLDKAHSLGWIQRWERGVGRAWKGTEYIPCIPNEAVHRADAG